MDIVEGKFENVKDVDIVSGDRIVVRISVFRSCKAIFIDNFGVIYYSKV